MVGAGPGSVPPGRAPSRHTTSPGPSNPECRHWGTARSSGMSPGWVPLPHTVPISLGFDIYHKYRYRWLVINLTCLFTYHPLFVQVSAAAPVVMSQSHRHILSGPVYVPKHFPCNTEPYWYHRALQYSGTGGRPTPSSGSGEFSRRLPPTLGVAAQSHHNRLNLVQCCRGSPGGVGALL